MGVVRGIALSFRGRGTLIRSIGVEHGEFSVTLVWEGMSCAIVERHNEGGLNWVSNSVIEAMRSLKSRTCLYENRRRTPTPISIKLFLKTHISQKLTVTDEK